MDDWWIKALGCIAFAAVGGSFFFIACSYLQASYMASEMMRQDCDIVSCEYLMRNTISNKRNVDSRSRAMASAFRLCAYALEFGMDFRHDKLSPSACVITLSVFAMAIILSQGLFPAFLAFPVACIVACQLAKRPSLWKGDHPHVEFFAVKHNLELLSQMRDGEADPRLLMRWGEEPDDCKANLWRSTFMELVTLAKDAASAKDGVIIVGVVMAALIILWQ